MSSFNRPLVVTPDPDDPGTTWVIVCGDFAYSLPGDVGGAMISVPQWMKTDFASVPQAIWWFVAPWGKHGNAAVIHDYGYWKQDRPKRDYDRIFYEAMIELGVGEVKARLMYWAVKCFGFHAWRTNAKKNQLLGPSWKMRTLDTIETLPVLEVTEAIRELSEAGTS